MTLNNVGRNICIVKQWKMKRTLDGSERRQDWVAPLGLRLRSVIAWIHHLPGSGIHKYSSLPLNLLAHELLVFINQNGKKRLKITDKRVRI